MPFLIETYDRPGHEHVRLRERDKHLEYLDGRQHLILAAGAKLSDDGERADGGIYLIDVDTREEAEEFIANDPFNKADLFEKVVVQRWRKAYLDGRNVL